MGKERAKSLIPESESIPPTGSDGPIEASAVEQPPSESPLQKELEDVKARRNDLLEELLEIEQQRLLMDHRGSDKDLIRELLGSDQGSDQGKLVERRRREAETARKEQLRKIEPEVTEEVLQQYKKNPSATALKQMASAGYWGDRTHNNRLRAEVQLSLQNRVGKQALQYPQNPVAKLSVQIGSGEIVNKHLQELVSEGNQANIGAAKKLSEKLSKKERKAFIENARDGLENISLEELKNSPDLRVKYLLLGEIFPELRKDLDIKGIHGGSSIRGGMEQAVDILNQLRADERFSRLESVLQGIPGLGTGAETVKKLERRGLVNTANENDFVSNILRLAAGEENEDVAERVESRLKSMAPGGRVSAIDDALNLNLVLTNLCASAVREFGLNPTQHTIAKRDELLQRLGLVDKVAIDRLTVLAGLSESTDPNVLRAILVRGQKDLPYKGETGDIVKSIMSGQHGATGLRELDNKLARTSRSPDTATQSAHSGNKAKPDFESSEIPDSEIIAWLDQSDLYREVADLITNPDTINLVKRNLGLNLEKKADMETYITRYFLRNGTTNKGERVYLVGMSGETVLAEDFADNSHFPVGDLVQFIRERGKNPKAPVPESLKRHYQKGRQVIDPYSEDDLDKKLLSADSLLRKARSGWKISLATIQYFSRKGKKFPPSIADCKEMVEEFVASRPGMKGEPSPLKYVLHYAGNEGQDESWLNDWDFQFNEKDENGQPLKWPSADGTVAAMMRSPKPDEENFRQFLQDMISTSKVIGAAEMEEIALAEFEKFLAGESEEETDISKFAA